MAKIKVLKDNELVGGTDNTSMYPVTSTKAVYDENNERLDNIIHKIKNTLVTNHTIANDTIEIEKLSPTLREVIKAATGVPGDLANDVTKLMREVFPLEIEVNITPTIIQEKGTNTEVIITWKATIENEVVNPDSVFINRLDVTDKTSYKEIVSDTKQFSVQITAKGRTTSINKYINYAYPIFTGFAPNIEFTESLVESLTKLKLRSSLGIITDTKTNTSTSNYYWIVSPYKINNITTNGINIISSFIYTTIEYKGTIYHCYRLNAPSSTDTFTFIIS